MAKFKIVFEKSHFNVAKHHCIKIQIYSKNMSAVVAVPNKKIVHAKKSSI